MVCEDRWIGEGVQGHKKASTFVLWVLWKHRNAIVFDGDTPSIERPIQKVKSEAKVWATAGLIKRDLESFHGRLYRWAMREE